MFNRTLQFYEGSEIAQYWVRAPVSLLETGNKESHHMDPFPAPHSTPHRDLVINNDTSLLPSASYSISHITSKVQVNSNCSFVLVFRFFSLFFVLKINGIQEYPVLSLKRFPRPFARVNSALIHSYVHGSKHSKVHLSFFFITHTWGRSPSSLRLELDSWLELDSGLKLTREMV